MYFDPLSKLLSLSPMAMSSENPGSTSAIRASDGRPAASGWDLSTRETSVNVKDDITRLIFLDFVLLLNLKPVPVNSWVCTDG